jgi:hypothetical protein
VKNNRPPGLVAIVVYKGFVALLLTATSIVLLLALENHQALVAASESYVLEGKLELIEWLLEKIINIKRQTLQFSGIASGIYAAKLQLKRLVCGMKRPGQIY